MYLLLEISVHVFTRKPGNSMLVCEGARRQTYYRSVMITKTGLSGSRDTTRKNVASMRYGILLMH